MSVMIRHTERSREPHGQNGDPSRGSGGGGGGGGGRDAVTKPLPPARAYLKEAMEQTDWEE